MVANKFLDEVEMSREIRGECVSMCKHFHQSVRGISDRYATIVILLIVSRLCLLHKVTRTDESQVKLRIGISVGLPVAACEKYYGTGFG